MGGRERTRTEKQKMLAGDLYDAGVDIRTGVGRFFADLDAQISFFTNQSQIVGPAVRLAWAPLIVDVWRVRSPISPLSWKSYQPSVL